MHLGLAEADQTFLRWVLRGQRSWLIRRHCPSRTPWCKPTGILSPALDSAIRGFADRARVQILGRRGPGAGSGVLQGSKTMPAKRAPIGGKGDDGGAPGGYVQVFLYRVPKANHDSFAATEEKLFAIFRRHGIVGSDLYVCGEARIFKGFRDLRAALEAAPEEEVWVEIDRYRDQADSIRVIEGIGKDPEAGSLFGRILQLAAPGVLCPQANAERVQL